MKKITALIIILYSVSFAIAQKQKTNHQKTTVITKTEFDKHLPAVDLITKASKEYKTKGKIRIKTINKTIILKDDGEMLEYRYEGELKGSDLIVIHEFEPNSEEYYLINKKNRQNRHLAWQANFSSQ